jgi:cell division protein FtsB
MAYNITKISSTSTVKKVAYIFTIIICLLIINGLVRSIFDLWNKQDLVVKAKEDLSHEKQKNQELKSQLSYVQSSEFIEEEARDKLFLVKPGESGVIVPEELIKKKEEKVIEIIPNYKQWINLFIGKN